MTKETELLCCPLPYPWIDLLQRKIQVCMFHQSLGYTGIIIISSSSSISISISIFLYTVVIKYKLVVRL